MNKSKLHGLEFDMVIIKEHVHDVGDFPSDVQPREVVTGKICPYCGRKPEFVDSIEIYGYRSYGMMYWCKPCGAYVGVHKGTKRALGRLANKELREWKQKAHAKFDSLWKMSKKPNRRSAAYAWLGEQMKLKPSRTHIGMFNVEQCQRAIQLCDDLLKSVTKGA